MNRPEDQVLVIFGASGDLTKRMLMPSLYELHVRQMLPERFVILGTSRKSMSDEEFRLSIRLMLEELKGEKGLDGEEVDRFLQKVFYQPFDPVEGADELGRTGDVFDGGKRYSDAGGVLSGNSAEFPAGNHEIHWKKLSVWRKGTGWMAPDRGGKTFRNKFGNGEGVG